MRLSPLLVVFLTTSAPLGLARTALGEVATWTEGNPDSLTQADSPSMVALESLDWSSLVSVASPLTDVNGAPLSETPNWGNPEQSVGIWDELLSHQLLSQESPEETPLSVAAATLPIPASLANNRAPQGLEQDNGELAQTEVSEQPGEPQSSETRVQGEMSPTEDRGETIIAGEMMIPPAAVTAPTALDLAQLPPSPLDQPPPAAPPAEGEPRVLVAEVVVAGDNLTPELEDVVYNAIRTQPGRTTTRSQLQEDVNAVFATGFFANVTQVPEDTPLGVRITFQVDVNPVLRQVVLQTLPEGAQQRAVPPEVVDEIFGGQYGETLNLRTLQENVMALNQWYQSNGYDLAQVLGSPQVSRDGVVTLQVAEGLIEDVQVRFLNEEGEEVSGRTRPFIVTREMQMAAGGIFQRDMAQADLQRVFGLGLFQDARLNFEPGTDPSQVIVNVEVQEGNTGSVAAGVGISSASGFFGTGSYQQRNVGGNNQDLTAELQIGTREFLFDVAFTDPWIAGDPYRTSYTVNAFRRRTISLIFDGGDPEIRLPNNDRPRVVRTGGGVNFVRPLAPDPFTRADWTLSAGFQYQAVSIQDGNADISPVDSLGNLLSFSPSGRDTIVALQLGAIYDRRNNPLQPTSGSLIRLGMDQTIPIGSGQIFFNRLRGSYSRYIPVDWFNLSRDPDAPQTLAFNIQAGTVLGDLPPYEAFSIGGANSVRGYEEGNVGSGRSYLQLTAEYRFPILSFIGGTLFVDYGTDLGSGSSVPGNPARVRNKPGSGLGYGVGVRIQSPLGPIRVDYGFNDQGDSRLHFGIGERF
ncbi:BamA/TamA family outer membrane protein [Spirulina subsalsa FACHB-351]|uniref:BamA/TamA family outer membrane protein n=1 Tax=Spirulina subsalsa FACHB-351 TaxID=234711 RepID=A0ABT3L3W8_9CYAN|nr:BamA/TamA family outer membrane protein [Spirulina subsalsa FACHB-351]